MLLKDLASAKEETIEGTPNQSPDDIDMMINILGIPLQVRGSVLKIAKIDGEKFIFAGDPDALVEALRRSRHGIDVFTFIQKVTEISPKHNYSLEWDNLAVLPISTFEHWWNQQIGFKARNKAKQAEKKGAVIREVPFNEDLVRGIWEIYNETPVRGGRRFPHFGKDYATVFREEATYLEQSVFLGAFYEDKLIGFIKLLCNAEGGQAGLLNIVSRVEHRDKAPTNALLAHAVKVCAARAIPFLVYSNFAYGKRTRDSLSDFKERNGFQRVNLPRYYVPLSPMGRLALTLGVHKKVSERIPEWLIVRLRDIRKVCYGRWFQSAPENV